MPYYLQYVFYRFYRWSERSGKNYPIIGVVFAVLIVGMLNVATVLAVAQISLGRGDFVRGFFGRSGGAFVAKAMVVALVILVLLVKSGIREQSLSEDSIKVYREKGYTDIGIWIYMICSLLLFVFSVWKAGGHG